MCVVLCRRLMVWSLGFRRMRPQEVARSTAQCWDTACLVQHFFGTYISRNLQLDFFEHFPHGCALCSSELLLIFSGGSYYRKLRAVGSQHSEFLKFMSGAIGLLCAFLSDLSLGFQGGGEEDEGLGIKTPGWRTQGPSEPCSFGDSRSLFRRLCSNSWVEIAYWVHRFHTSCSQGLLS